MTKLLRMKYKKQFGNSMLEMLGVLAIIGILSIGGVSMYRRAMDTHRVNETVHDMSLLGAAILERNAAYTGTDCTFFTQSQLNVPSEFQTCTVTTRPNGSIIFTVTYKNNVSRRFIDGLVDRCSRELYISSDATQFAVGRHGLTCGQAAGSGQQGDQTGGQTGGQTGSQTGGEQQGGQTGGQTGGQQTEPQQDVPEYVCITVVYPGNGGDHGYDCDP